jgi:hypothetical protein
MEVSKMMVHRRVPIALATAGLVVVVAGCQAAPAAPAAAPVATNLFIAADMVQGSKNIPDNLKASRSCVLTSRFPKNSEMVWRVRVSDPVTGEMMGKDVLDKVEVRLANGVLLEAQYAPHPKDPPGESFWTASWVVPRDAPSGTLTYTIVATDSKGRTGEWKPFSTTPSLPIITDELLG